MDTVDLSLLIPSRNEQFLNRTIQDILENRRGLTEIIVGLDGSWPTEPIPDDERVTIVYRPTPVGQRAITNDCARVARGWYVMKLDAHCAVAPGFDVTMLEDMQDDMTMVPIMRNLHVFDWVCKNGHRRYQGPSGPCRECDEPTEREMVWKAKTNPQSRSYCFDATPHFAYFGEYTKRPEYKRALAENSLTETMSLQGSCFLMTKQKYWDLDVCDEAFGTWGSQGIEVACKTWLSGGRCVVNHRTWYAHLFRTQGQDFGFPYPLGGRQVEHAKKMARDLFFKNKWPKQVRPLSWLIEKFWPIPGWTEKDLSSLHQAPPPLRNPSDKLIGVHAVASPVPLPMTNHTAPMPIDWRREEVPVSAMGLPGVSSSRPSPLQDIGGIGEQLQVNGIAAEFIAADVIQNGDVLTLTVGDGFNQPSVHESMGTVADLLESEIAISSRGSGPDPNPAPSFAIDSNLAEDTDHRHQGNMRDIQHLVHTRNIPLIDPGVKSKGIVYYTDNRLDDGIMAACQRQLEKPGLPIVSVSLQPLEGFGKNVVVDAERGPLTLLRQQLAGVEVCAADVIFLAEHDVLYDPSHFDFTPPRDDTFYYNTNVWKVRHPDGHAIWTDGLQQTSGLCAKRQLLLDYLHTRIAQVEANGFDRHYEPGPKVGNWKAENWQSARPNLDIRHDRNQTKTRWTPDEYRDKRYAQGWKEAEEVAPWYAQGQFERLLAGG